MQYFTFTEFHIYLNQREISALDKFIGYTKRNKKFYLKLVFSVALLLFLGCNVAFAKDVNLDKIDTLGNKGMSIIYRIAYWAVLIKGGMDMVGKGVNGDSKGVFKGALGYGGIFLTLYLFPMMLDMIREAFQ